MINLNLPGAKVSAAVHTVRLQTDAHLLKLRLNLH